MQVEASHPACTHLYQLPTITVVTDNMKR
jgi:hypothetical protein